MARRFSTERLARASARHPWCVLCAWAAGLLAAALSVAALMGGALEMLVMMGLAVGIDYSIFVLSRFREERGLGREQVDAVAAAGATASRAVLFSGVAVVLGLLGMFLVPQTIFRSLATGAAAAGCGLASPRRSCGGRVSASRQAPPARLRGRPSARARGAHLPLGLGTAK
jgi:uncharacterized membrane protein YdfJ with MMPL/SSD domain